MEGNFGCSRSAAGADDGERGSTAMAPLFPGPAGGDDAAMTRAQSRITRLLAGQFGLRCRRAPRLPACCSKHGDAATHWPCWPNTPRRIRNRQSVWGLRIAQLLAQSGDVDGACGGIDQLAAALSRTPDLVYQRATILRNRWLHLAEAVNTFEGALKSRPG